MNNELSTEMMEQLFKSDIFILKEKEKINGFCLGKKIDYPVKLVVLIKDAANEKASTSDIDLLNKIADFKDYHLKREKVIVLNLAKFPASYSLLRDEFSSPNIIGFGITPLEVGLQIEHLPNQLVRFRGVNFIFTLSLSEISKNDKVKGEFFREALKPMFNSENYAVS